MLPSERFMTRIGVAPFDAMPEFHTDTLLPKELRLPMRQHAGAPAAPVVKAGDSVEAGALLGAAAGVISANIHAPAAGRIQSVDAAGVTLVPARG